MEIKKPRSFRLNRRLTPDNVILVLPHRQIETVELFGHLRYICGCENTDITLIEYDPTNKIVWVYINAWSHLFPNHFNFNNIVNITKTQIFQHFGWIPKNVYITHQELSFTEYKEITLN